MSTVTKDEALEVIARNVKRLMDAQDVGVRQLARDADANHMTVSRLVNGLGLPSPDALYRMAKCLGVTVDDLFRKKTP